MAGLAVVILAAGHGTRMNSHQQKILHEVGGRPMIAHLFDEAAAAADRPPVLVVGPGEDGVRGLFGDRAQYARQDEPLGTGHATLMAEPLLRGRAGQVLVTYADMPLLRVATMRRLAERQAETAAEVVMLSFMGELPSSYGRVVRDAEGRVAEVVEVAEARQRPDGDHILAIRELNPGLYCFDGGWLWANLPELPLRQARDGREYYLTDLVGRAVGQGGRVEAIVAEDPDECLGAGNRHELVAVEKAFRRRANDRWLSAGVTLVDPDATYLDQTVAIGRDTVIWPNTFVQGRSVVGEACVLGPNAIIRDAELGDGCRVEQAVVESVTLPAGSHVMPGQYVRGE